MFINKYQNPFAKFRNEAGESGDEGGSGGAAEVTPEAFAALQAELEDQRKQNERMRAKNEELLGETKAAKERRRKAEEEAARAAEEKALKDGDYEQLLKSSQEKNQTLQQQLEELNNKVRTEKSRSAMDKLCAKLADGENASLLAELNYGRLSFDGEELKVLDEKGDLTVSSVEDLENEIKSNPRFKALLRGSKASGSGANGSGANGAPIKQITRDEFNQMDHDQRAKFFEDGGKIVSS